MREMARREVGWLAAFAAALLLGAFGFLVPGVCEGAGSGDGAAAIAAQGAREVGVPPNLPEGAKVSERIVHLPGLSHVGRVAPGIFRGAQPLPEGYATLAIMGVRTVINLRSRNGEKKTVEAWGMRSVGLPMDAYGDVDPETVRKAVALMADPANQPVFVHCRQGRDRTGLVVAVYRMEVDGWTPEEAEEEMQAYGFHDVWFRMKNFVHRYRSGNGTGTGREEGERGGGTP